MRVFVRAGAKHLIDLYAATLPFTHVLLLEPDAVAMDIPRAYRNTTDIRVSRRFVEVGTRRLADADANADMWRGPATDYSSRKRPPPLSPPVDLVAWLPYLVTRDDFVVLKFDVDEGKHGQTVEWGFLADLVHSPAMRLVDEIYIELHFAWNAHSKKDVALGVMPTTVDPNKSSSGTTRSFTMGWHHYSHSMRQAFDLMRELRRCGVAVHAWP